MAERLFVFVQFEFPWVLGPADGRYLLRESPDGEAERVIVLMRIGAALAPSEMRELRGPAGWLLRRLSSGGPGRPASPEPARVSTTRVTVIDPIPLSAELQARAWLNELDREHDVQAALAHVNRVLQAHRIASADPYVHEVSATQALVVRAGWGEGEQVASGQWLHARELSLRPRRAVGRRRDRSHALRPQERLAALLGGRSIDLLCEELALRARLDLDHGRFDQATVSLDRALELAVGELGAERRQDLALRIAELEQLRSGVAEQAQKVRSQGAREPDEEMIGHALGRLEAALRARTATGV
jgi:hypothetical protein